MPNWAGPENTATEGFAMRLWARLGEPVLLEIVVTAALALLCISGIVRWTGVAAADAQSIGAPAGKPDGLFRGGVMDRHLITSGSLAGLELFDWGRAAARDRDQPLGRPDLGSHV